MLKRFGPLVICLLVGFLCVPDWPTFQVTLARLSVAGLVVWLAMALIGVGRDWGLFPDIDIPSLCRRAEHTPTGAAVVLLGLLVLLAAIVSAVAR